MTFTPVDPPRAFRDVLLEAWCNAEGLRGRPDIPRINRHLARTALNWYGIWQKSELRSRSPMPGRNRNVQSGNPLDFSFLTPYFRMYGKNKIKMDFISGSRQAG